MERSFQCEGDQRPEHSVASHFDIEIAIVSAPSTKRVLFYFTIGQGDIDHEDTKLNNEAKRRRGSIPNG